MSKRCPICDSDKTLLRIQNDVKAGSPYRGQALEALKVPRAPIQVFRCQECVLDFLESWDDTDKVICFYENNHYVCRPNVTEGFRKYDETGSMIFIRKRWSRPASATSCPAGHGPRECEL